MRSLTRATFREATSCPIRSTPAPPLSSQERLRCHRIFRSPRRLIAPHVFAGQNVSVASQVIVTSGGTNTHATTITLTPQTINGTITGVSSSGGFTVYTVSLAAYDLFPILAVQPGQTTALQNPSSVEVRGQQ